MKLGEEWLSCSDVMTPADAELAEVVRRELMLLDRRFAARQIGCFLSPDFVEVGASGRSWDDDGPCGAR